MHSQSLQKKDWCNIYTVSSSMCFSQLWQYITKSDKNKIKIKVILILLMSARDQKWHSVQTTSFPTLYDTDSWSKLSLFYAPFSQRCCPPRSSLPPSPFKYKQLIICLPRLSFCLSINVIPLWLAFYGWFWDFEQRNNPPPTHFLTNSYLRVRVWEFIIFFN